MIQLHKRMERKESGEGDKGKREVMIKYFFQLLF